jgi:acyl-CoA synthetase (AMP-forming)/AMP-acid ligase II
VDDVEGALRRATGSDVVIVGVPHPRLGQVVAAVVTTQAGAPRIRARARTELAPAQRPRLWFSVPSFPVTASGKVDRSTLAAMAAAGRLIAVSPLSRR